MAKRRKRNKNQRINPYVWSSILGVFCLVLSALVMVSFLRRGAFLILLNQFVDTNFGAGALVLPFILIQLSLICFQSPWIWSRPAMLLGGGLFFAGLTGLVRGGTVGAAAFTTLSHLLTGIGAGLFFFALIVAGLLVLWQVSFHDLLVWWKKFSTERQLKQEMADFIDENNPEAVSFVGQDSDAKTTTDTPLPQDHAAAFAGQTADNWDQDTVKTTLPPTPVTNPFDKIPILDDLKPPVVIPDSTAPADPADRPPWQYPTLDLLEGKDGGQADRGDIKGNADKIIETLDSFGVRARISGVNRGPSITQYCLEIALGTKLSKITALANDLALALAAPTGQIRIEAPIPGTNLVGVEVPNRQAAFVTLYEMLGSKTLKDHPSKLAVAMGLDVNGKQIVGDIAKMPHVLIAGATGSGKSVGINSFLCTLLFRCSPEELRLILVDPKRVELTMYQDIPHLLTPVIVDASKVVSALKWACEEMDQRYKLLAENGARNIDAYNAKPGLEHLPHIIIVVDEFADIIMFAPNEVEETVTRLAQMARAVGIHLVLATQRPSVNVITGLIKANIPTRISFNVASAMDSRVVLDTVGAEKLLGNGDMLYIPPDQAKPIRIQGTFVSDADAHHLTDFLKHQGWRPEYSEEVTSKYRASTGGKRSSSNTAAQDEDHDDLFFEAVKMFAQYDQASSSMIQRRLKVGYARAARILDQLCGAGIVGEANGSKPRPVNRDAMTAFLSDPANLR